MQAGFGMREPFSSSQAINEIGGNFKCSASELCQARASESKLRSTGTGLKVSSDAGQATLATMTSVNPYKSYNAAFNWS
jgi:hypothetical protein